MHVQGWQKLVSVTKVTPDIFTWQSLNWDWNVVLSILDFYDCWFSEVPLFGRYFIQWIILYYHILSIKFPSWFLKQFTLPYIYQYHVNIMFNSIPRTQLCFHSHCKVHWQLIDNNSNTRESITIPESCSKLNYRALIMKLDHTVQT